MAFALWEHFQRSSGTLSLGKWTHSSCIVSCNRFRKMRACRRELRATSVRTESLDSYGCLTQVRRSSQNRRKARNVCQMAYALAANQQDFQSRARTLHQLSRMTKALRPDRSLTKTRSHRASDLLPVLACAENFQRNPAENLCAPRPPAYLPETLNVQSITRCLKA